MTSTALAALDRQARRGAEYIARHPAAGIAACFGAGYLAGKLPILRFLAGTVRVAIPLAPPLLAVLGAARVWDLVAPPDGSVAPPPREEGEALNQLLAMALASRESYGRAAPRFDGEDRRLVEHLRAVHDDAVRLLKKAVQDAGVFPLLGNSPWDGLVDQLAHVSSGRLADSPLFSLMLSAEESAVRTFEAALLDPSFDEEKKTLLRRHLLPRAQENVNSLLRQRTQELPQLATVTP
ncbi:hypothetical protein OKA05_11045 [Luteolibacter arcticus]|uniref:DUF2383 domain-containing protein n=1 Tax=Luteolibacter arcticus TaxID=1581411 RepID=A0ABT3GHW1_9BACT|nr:hypothetical protein [Luteolibacter arcticus]MCW1923090.1 hypothetical protein [Luteolibacter arcticus]